MDFDTLFLELVDSTNMISALTSGLTDEDARFKPTPETWSILEVVCHLFDEEREDFRLRLGCILRGSVDQWRPIHPGAWVTERKYNERELRDMKEKFFAERSQSLDWLKGQSGADWNTTLTHESRTMCAGDMFASWIAHDNLHVRQLVELRRARIERISLPYAIGYAGDW